MACLFGCFSVSKHKKRKFFINTESSLKPRHEAADRALLRARKQENQEHAEKPSDVISITKEKHEEKVKSSVEKKDLLELVSDAQEESPIKAISDELIEQNSEKEDEEYNEEQRGTRQIPESESSHWTQNCSRTSDSFKDLEFKGLKGADDVNGEKERRYMVEESSESLFSLSIESRKRVNEIEFDGEKEVTSPIVNKKTTSRTMETNLKENSNRNAQDLAPIHQPPEGQEKEKLGGEAETRCQEQILNCSSRKRAVDQENSIDTSLSSWLVESDETHYAIGNSNSASKIRNSARSYEDRWALKELNLQEPKQGVAVCMSKSSTRDQISDDVPLIGTIGSYWSCTEQTQNRPAAI